MSKNSKSKTSSKRSRKTQLTDTNAIKAIQNSSFFQLAPPKPQTDHTDPDVTLEDIEVAFALINPKDKGKRITAQQFSSKINFLAGLLPDFDAKVLMNNKQELTSEELLGLLRQIDSPGIDTSKSVFEALDRKGNGEVDLQFLSNLMEKFGIETFGEKDFEFLLECMDEDGDGVVGLADFRNFLGRENK